jgi:hypothetical protein
MPYFPPLKNVPGPVDNGGGATKGTAPLGFYASPVRDKQGNIDVAKTIASVKKNGGTFYQFLVANHWGYNSVKDFAALPHFLDVARANKITVRVVLLPPTEASTVCKCTSDGYAPYNADYDRWYAELGKMAKTHPAMVGTGMDDYVYSSLARPNRDCNSFSASTPARWQAISKKSAGRALPFAPTMYFGDLANGRSQNFNAFKGSVTEVVWPFQEIGHSGRIAAQYALIHKLHPKTKITIMIYAHYYKGQVPTAKTVRDEVAAARKLGPTAVVVYQYKLG